MLVLTRKVGERLIIGDDIIVEVTKVAGDRVRIGIIAPPEVPVRRPEAKVQERKEVERA